MFAVRHKRLKQYFSDINDRAKTTHHYWADNSRDLMALIEELHQDLHDLKQAGVEVKFVDNCQQAIERCEPWLSLSGGSVVSDEFEQIELIKFEPVFDRPATAVKLKNSSPQWS